MGRSGRRSEGRGVTGERGLVSVLARDERGFNPTQQPQINTHIDTVLTSARMHTVYTVYTLTDCTRSQTPADL